MVANRKSKENKGGEDTDETKDVREAHLVVAALIATVTFAAGFTIPGGYQSEKGFAVLSRNAAFNAFVISDTLDLSLVAMVVAFITGTYAVLGHSPILALVVASVLGCSFFFILTHTALSEVFPSYQRLQQFLEQILQHIYGREAILFISIIMDLAILG
ncbi:hypothetical protein L3X38_039588 [Prunus dulcis]|uniref:PGG domain-containing protein n=1 Tax=Prunus dulcis TaxID=3755 RepID=A0AAD4V7F5_PRUDU|nr:hypothetical protein L3X38_039588 [Prunus dulcis]